MNKMSKILSAAVFVLILATAGLADVKVRQKMTMSGQTFETTKMIKGSRQRTEQKMGAAMGAADFMSQVATITQCDLRRTVQVNDTKKIYLATPFAEETGAQAKPAGSAPQRAGTTKRGGTVTMTFSVKDTGERKTLFGLTARHLIILQEMESSADSCSGASKTKMELDGWYVDFSAEFNCPYELERAAPPPSTKPDCLDRMVVKGDGAAKTGFLLNGTMKFFDASGNVQMTQTTETLELSRAPLADSLFNVPQDYRLVSSQQDLYSIPSAAEMMQQQTGNNDARNQNSSSGQNNLPQAPVTKTVGVNVAVASGAKINQAEISQHLMEKLRENDLTASPGTGGGSFNYVINVEVKQAKESTAGKIGGMFGKVTGVDTKVGKTDVELIVTLTAPGSSAPITQSRVAKKFDGAASEAIRAAIDEAMPKILAAIEH